MFIFTKGIFIYVFYTISFLAQALVPGMVEECGMKNRMGTFFHRKKKKI